MKKKIIVLGLVAFCFMIVLGSALYIRSQERKTVLLDLENISMASLREKPIQKVLEGTLQDYPISIRYLSEDPDDSKTNCISISISNLPKGFWTHTYISDNGNIPNNRSGFKQWVSTAVGSGDAMPQSMTEYSTSYSTGEHVHRHEILDKELDSIGIHIGLGRSK